MENKALKENLANLAGSNLPAHLKAALERHYRKAASFGIDPDFIAKSKAKADKSGNDFNPVHAVIG